MTVPVIDLSSTFIKCQDNWDSVAEDLVHALHHTGFLYLIGHGIDQDLVDQTFKATKSFFHLPLNTKKQYDRTSLESFIGYLELREEKFPGMKHLEYKECFNIDLSNPVLPAEPPQLAPVITEFTNACYELQDRVYRLLATGLGLQNLDEFLQMLSSDEQHKNQRNVKFVRYPGIPNGREVQDMVRCAQHTDFGVLTFVFQDDVGGLEAKTPQGAWMPATPISCSVFVNVGEVLEMWTNGYLRATPHRILIRGNDDESLRRDRYSVIFFSTPHDDAPLAPMETKFFTNKELTETPAEKKQFNEVGMTTTGEYFAWRYKTNVDNIV